MKIINNVETNGRIIERMECPLSVYGDGCKLNKRIKCRFGLTEIRVPLKCPLKQGPVTFTYNLLEEKLEE